MSSNLIRPFLITLCMFCVPLNAFAAGPGCPFSQGYESPKKMPSTATNTTSFRVNTSNELKIAEFRRFFGNVISEKHDLAEPDADPITIIRFKASQFDRVIIDDTSLEIEGEDFGPKIKWRLHDLGNQIGKSADFVCFLAIKLESNVYVYKGEIKGTIVEPKGTPYGFLHYFRPNGASKTLAEDLPDHLNARFYAAKNLLSGDYFGVFDPLYKWDGPFQPR